MYLKHRRDTGSEGHRDAPAESAVEGALEGSPGGPSPSTTATPQRAAHNRLDSTPSNKGSATLVGDGGTHRMLARVLGASAPGPSDLPSRGIADGRPVPAGRPIAPGRFFLCGVFRCARPCSTRRRPPTVRRAAAHQDPCAARRRGVLLPRMAAGVGWTRHPQRRREGLHCPLWKWSTA